MRKIFVMAALLGLAACNNPAEKTLSLAANAIEQNDVESFEALLVNRLAIKNYYTQEEVFNFYGELLSKYEQVKLENLAKDRNISQPANEIYMVASISAKPILAEFSYRNGRDDAPGGDIRMQPRLGEREVVRHVKFICEKSDNKYGYDNCLIASFAVSKAKGSQAEDSYLDGME